MRLFRCLLAPIVLVATLASFTASPHWNRPAVEYERRELTIPVRDGVRLFAVALIPKGATAPLPIILVRTPFSAAGMLPSRELPAMYRELGEDGYIFVVEDIRGRFGSGGQFVVSRPLHDPRDPRGVDESTDAYDTIDWLVKQLPGNNGKVGALGFSYGGWLAGMAGINPHPALKAISPQAPMVDTWLGDDFFHQGAFRQTMAVEFAALMERDPKGFSDFSIPTYDRYDFYRQLRTLGELAKATNVTTLPSWAGPAAHPAYDAYWQARAMQRSLTASTVPMLWVGGWWDQEDILGAQLGYATVEQRDTKRTNRIVLGPWFHNGWLRGPGDSLGPFGLGSNTGQYFREQVQRPWFAYHLHGTGNGSFPEGVAFESGANRWRTFDQWPPAAAAPRKLYLHAGGLLSFDPPSAGTAASYDAYTADPAHPVPYLPRPDNGDGWRTWLLQDQRFVDGRPDVATWQSAPLTEDLTVAGDVTAKLFASTSGTDADWVVKLIDVYPDSVAENPALGGYQLMVNADILRGRYWKGFSVGTPIPANVVTPFTVDLHQQLYRFKKGHRLMVQVQSSWFPLYDRNPQTFVPNIFNARPADFRAQEHRIWHTPARASHIAVRVLP